MSIGEKIYERREALGLTLAQLADRMGVSEATVQRWEAGVIHPKYRRILMLAQVLNLDYNELMDWESDQSDSPSAILDMSDFSPAKRYVADSLGNMTEADAAVLQSWLRRIQRDEETDRGNL